MSIRLILLSYSLLYSGLFADLQKGKELYHQICMTCHGHDLNGGIGPSLIDDYWKHGDQPNEIFHTISEGVYDSNMVSFKNIYSEKDRRSLVEFIIAQQKGLRSVKRYAYANDSLQNKDLSLDGLKDAKVVKEFKHPENHIYFDHNPTLITKIEANLYIPKEDTYTIDFKTNYFHGVNKIYLDGKLIDEFSSQGQVELKRQSQEIPLEAGVHKLTMLHQKHKNGHHRLFGSLISKAGLKFKLFGESMKGAAPKVISADGRAKVFRKKVHGLSPRSVLAVLPNHVILSINTEYAGIEKAWHSAKIDMTKSLAQRGAADTEIIGQVLPATIAQIKQQGHPGHIQYLASHIDGPNLNLELKIDQTPYIFTYTAKGKNGYKIIATTPNKVEALEISLHAPIKINGKIQQGKVLLKGPETQTFTIESGE